MFSRKNQKKSKSFLPLASLALFSALEYRLLLAVAQLIIAGPAFVDLAFAISFIDLAFFSQLAHKAIILLLARGMRGIE